LLNGGEKGRHGLISPPFERISGGRIKAVTLVI
jgi:hypothetical protein